MRLHRTRHTFAAMAAASVLLMTSACGSDDQADTADTSQGQSDSGSSAETSLKAGTYQASGSYPIPSGGQSEVDVSVTIDDSGEITEIEVTPKSGGTSAQYQGQFAGGIADEAVGVNIEDLEVSKVSGSSLTSGGFNAAIEDIISQAQA